MNLKSSITLQIALLEIEHSDKCAVISEPSSILEIEKGKESFTDDFARLWYPGEKAHLFINAVPHSIGAAPVLGGRNRLISNRNHDMHQEINTTYTKSPPPVSHYTLASENDVQFSIQDIDM